MPRKPDAPRPARVSRPSPVSHPTARARAVLAARAASRSECAFCASICGSLLIHHDRNETFPPEIDRFLRRTLGGDIRQCPACHTYYHYERIDDNEVGLEVHTQELSKMRAERAEALIEEEEAMEAHFKSALGQRFAHAIQGLGEGERRVFNHLIRNRWIRSTLEGVREQLPDLPDPGAVLATLVSRNMVRRTLSPPPAGEPGEGLVLYELAVPFLELMGIRRQFTEAREQKRPRGQSRRKRRRPLIRACK